MGLFKNIKAALFPPDQEPGDPPPWLTRLKPAKYVSLSGVEIEFLYLDLSLFVPIKSTVFENVDGDGAYVQNNGLGATRYPWLMVFTDGDNDLLAKIALGALVEPGDGTLYHPIIGPIDVGLTGEIEQVNGFVTAANQTSIVVEFVETTGLLIGDAPAFPSAMQNYLDDSSQSFEDALTMVDTAEEVSVGEKIKQEIAKVKKTLDAISSGVAKSQAKMDDTFDSINESMDILIKDPLMLARQVQSLILAPAYEINMMGAKLAAYRQMAEDIFLGYPEPKTSSYDNTSQNDFAVNALMAETSTAALVQSAFLSATGDSDEVQYKKDFVKIQNDVAEKLNQFITWSDSSAGTLGMTNNSGGWGALNAISSIAIASLTSRISNAKSEIKFTTTYDRSAMAWCYELYQSVKPDMLIYFQRTNDLGGDEILTILAGRELVYYV